jgi:tripartite-type tricarboxylate transporter receptor subunit TctC
MARIEEAFMGETVADSRGSLERIRVVAAVAIGALFLLQPVAAPAQTWPSRPINLIVPFTAGTTSDVVARTLADHLSRTLGEPVVVDNRGGAGGNLGGALVAKAAPDGYTLLLATTGPAATNKFMYKEMAFDPQIDFTPIALVGQSPVVIVAGPTVPAKTLKALIDYAKANPDRLTAGFPGRGTLGHVGGELLAQRAGIKFSYTQYRGSTPIMTDLLGGHIDFAMDSMAAYVPNVREGKLLALAIASTQRWSGLPDVPTVAESGVPIEASVWYALLAPASTPAPVVATLNAAMNEALQEPRTKQIFDNLGIAAAGGTPQDLQTFIAAELEKWGPIIKAANITLE